MGVQGIRSTSELEGQGMQDQVSGDLRGRSEGSNPGCKLRSIVKGIREPGAKFQGRSKNRGRESGSWIRSQENQRYP